MIAVPLVILLVLFLFVPQITKALGCNLDSVPMRFAAVFTILAAVSYDKILAIGVFLVITAIYIQHHDNDISAVLGTANNSLPYSADGSLYSRTMSKLEQGGDAEESYDVSDFTSKTEDQDNEFSSQGPSIDEKNVLSTEHPGSRSSALFPEDIRNVNSMENSNKNGYSE